MNPEIAIVLPAFNEEKDLPLLLENIRTKLAPTSLNWKVIIVDDGSKDRTAEIAEDAALTMPLTLIRHEVNRGLGEAIKTGLTAAAHTADVIITCDADNSHDPIYMPAMVAELERTGKDLIIASRFQKGSIVTGVPYLRRLMSWGVIALMKTLLPFKNVRDYSTGFRAYRATTLQKLIQRTRGKIVEESGFVCMLEVLLKLRAIGATAGEIPYTLRYDLKQGASKIRIFRTIRRYFSVIARFRKKDVLPPASNTVPVPVAR